MMYSLKRLVALLLCLILVCPSGSLSMAFADPTSRTNDNPGAQQAPVAEYDIWDKSVFESSSSSKLHSMARDSTSLLVSEANITFYIDTTGSMSSYIYSVRSNITAFVEYLVTYGITVNLQLVEFRDLTCDGSNSFRQYFFRDPETGSSTPSTTDANVFIDAMNKLYVAGGGDWDETPTNAIYNYLPPVTDNTVSFAFLLTDAGAKESDDDSRIIDIATVSEVLLKNDIHMSVVSDYDYEPQYRPLYKPTSGLFIDINSRDYYALMLKIAQWVIEETEAVNKTFNYPGMYNKTKDATSHYFYEDDYFRASSWGYNPHLSTMSLCLELSGWGSYESSSTVWKGEERSKNAYALLNEIGFNNIERNDYWNSEPDTETVGLISAWKSIDDFTLVTLVVRGGDYHAEWSGNFVLGGFGEHLNWDKMSDHAVTYLTKYINEYKDKEGFNSSHIKLWIVGYSRGGAIANMTAGKILTESALPWTIAKEDLYCYTFEAPQGSVKNFAGIVHLPIHNIINFNDLVPLVAMKEYDFKRYPTDRYLPNVSSWSYEDAKDNMKKQFELITGGEDYKVPDYTRQIDIDVSVKGNLLSGYYLEPEIHVTDNNDFTNAEMLSTVLGNLTEGIGTRRDYVNNIQEGVKFLLKEVTRFNSSVKTEKIGENFKKVFIDNKLEGIRGVVSRYYDLDVSWGGITFTNPEAAAEYLTDLVMEALSKSGFDVHRYETIDTIVTVRSVLSALGTALVDDAWSIVTLLDNLFGLAPNESGELEGIEGRDFFQAHYPEVTLAWLRSQDSYYTSDAFLTKYPDIIRIIRVNCPVDLNLYGPNGELVAKIVDDKVTSYNEYIGCSVNKDGEKTFRVPGDADFMIDITANDDGTMNYQISEYTLGANEYTRVRNYTDITINKGDKLVANIPAISETEYGDPEVDGTDTRYSLVHNGEVLDATSDVRGDTKVKSFIVTTQIKGGAGFVVGGGEYVMGSFAQVEVVTNSELEADSKFVGWYINDKLVSTEKVYRFAVTKDVTLVAMFDSEPGEIPPTTPETGDSIPVGLLLMMLSVSLVLLFSISFVSRKRRMS